MSETLPLLRMRCDALHVATFLGKLLGECSTTSHAGASWANSTHQWLWLGFTESGERRAASQG